MNNRKLIYNFNEHGLYYKPNYISLYEILTLTMGTVQFEFNYKTGRLLIIMGYMPLFKSIRKNIDIPYYTNRDFSIYTNEIECQKGVAYDYFDFFPASKEYFMIDEYNPKLVYDENNKRIQIGTADIDDEYIRINKNTICGLDKKGNLKSILLLIDVIIKAD